MATRDGPITEGIKNAIIASELTPYAIAKAVTARGKVKLTPAQIYKFKSGTTGLTLAILDEIAVVLKLVVQVRQEVATPAPKSQECPAVETPERTIHDTSTYEGRHAARLARREKRLERYDPEMVARLEARRRERESRLSVLRDSVNEMQDSLADRRAVRAAKSNVFDDDDDVIEQGNAERSSVFERHRAPRAKRRYISAAEIDARVRGEEYKPYVMPEEEEQTWENYNPPPRVALMMKSQGDINGRDYIERIQHLKIALSDDVEDFTGPPTELEKKSMEGTDILAQVFQRRYYAKLTPHIRNKGVIALAKRYGDPKIRIDKYERARFWEFFTSLQINPHFKTFDGMLDLVERYKMIAKRVHMTLTIGKVGEIITPDDMLLAESDPEGLFKHLHGKLMKEGTANGVEGYFG